ncbi:VOC family protein [Sphingorhabdus sp. 109]|jgi:catechol 2,3-dioxygenase-like lactoylglutathione lyase family enzyme|uniref:VOC family protein n=1 Tax=Sphingorhabdus sp. 109 TaxID=2653173 RepID=UPI0012F0B5B7|nr:VOC family protein [Sphingorhabdus sp. 109]VWX59748.1 Glyoxalase/bleomycin resistance protein/dioxygenase superfamily protein [Sphingorhabdus sp. 109]
MTHELHHGAILGGVAVVPDLEAALRDYRDILGMTLVEQGALSASLAASWGCPKSSGAPMAALQPASGADCHIRLVEQPDHPGFKPTTTYGWAAYELTVQDVFGWPDRLTGSGFDIVGPPKELAGLPYFVPMQVLGTGREMVYLNEVRDNTPTSDLPKAQSSTDHIFIVILATPDRTATVKWYCERIRLTEADTYTLAYSMINNAFGLPADTLSDLTMVQNGRLPIIEVDDYPEEATDRGHHEGMLPPGNALVSLAVNDLDQLAVDWITPPLARQAAPYCGRRTGTTTGPAGELLELIEIG